MNIETRQCQSCKQRFTTEPDDVAFWERFDLPVSRKCPICAWKHLMSFWVFGKFRKTKSALSGKSIITNLPESSPFPIFEYEEWISDSWDPLVYGKEYDPGRSFLEQFSELQKEVPHPHRSGTNNVHCDWCDDASECKDCYLSRSMLGCEYLSYSYRNVNSKNSIDLVFCFDMENSYDCTYCFKCYEVRHAFNARNCIESAFLYDCRNCQNCFMCWNLRNKQFCIMNEQYSKEEYFAKLKDYDLRSYKSVNALKKIFSEKLAKEAVHRADFNVNAVSSSGNFLEECKRCNNCFSLQKSENCRHLLRGYEGKDVIYGSGSIAEKSAWTVMDWSVYETAFSSHSASCRYSMYLDYCDKCEYCFGCVGLKSKQYCILNKQYSREDHEKLVAQIKADMKKSGEWGSFFPLSMTYSGYNLSMANIYFPDTKENIERAGGRWDDIIDTRYEGISGEDVPDLIDSVSADFSKRAIICPKTNWRFNIAPHELEFHRQHGIPLPHYHPDWRTLQQLKPLVAIKSFFAPCWFCSKNTTHFYPPEWGYKKIVCVKCYQKEVV